MFESVFGAFINAVSAPDSSRISHELFKLIYKFADELDFYSQQ